MDKSYTTVEDIKLIDFPHFVDNKNSSLEVFEGTTKVPFHIERMFTIHANQGIKRGNHAHKSCNQLLICTEGSCEVTCDDGTHKTNICLDDPGKGLFIPHSLWAEQNYQSSPTLLIVLCDQHYEDEDYIRDYDLFSSYRRRLYH